MGREYPTFVGLMIAVPLSGKPLVPYFTWSMMNLHPPMNFNCRHAIQMYQPVDAARNFLAEQAIQQKCEYLFFVDEDVTIPAHGLRQLLFHMEHHPEIDVVGGIYCHKAQPSAPMVFRGNGRGPYWDWKIGELFEISGIGMGCTLIRTSVFAKLEKPYFKTIDDADPFLDGVNKAEQWTEDLYFCDKVIKAGGKIFADGAILCDHWDTSVFPPRPARLPEGSLPTRKAGVIKGEKKIVDLGAGECPYTCDDGQVLTVDIREDVKPDYRCDLRRLPFGNNEFDVVFSSHVLEHFSRDEVDATLDEWVRILKEDGEFRLVVPSIQWAADMIQKGIVDDNVLNVLYGAQTYDENFHKVGFTPKIIEDKFKARGFKRIDISLTGYNIYARAWRVPPDPEKVPLLPEKTRVFPESAVGDHVEAPPVTSPLAIPEAEAVKLAITEIHVEQELTPTQGLKSLDITFEQHAQDVPDLVPSGD